MRISHIMDTLTRLPTLVLWPSFITSFNLRRNIRCFQPKNRSAAQKTRLKMLTFHHGFTKDFCKHVLETNKWRKEATKWKLWIKNRCISSILWARWVQFNANIRFFNIFLSNLIILSHHKRYLFVFSLFNSI